MTAYCTTFEFFYDSNGGPTDLAIRSIRLWRQTLMWVYCELILQ